MQLNRNWKKSELVLQPIQYLAKGNKLVAYACLSFKNCMAEIIWETIIGSKSKVSEKDIRQLLLANGYDNYILVKVSNASYK